MLSAPTYHALSNVQVLLAETALLAERRLRGDSWTDLKLEAQEGQLFGKTRPASQGTILTALKARLEGQPSEVLELLYQGSLEARQILNLALTLQHRRVLSRFMTDVLVSKWQAFDPRVTDAEVRGFLSHLADQEQEVAAWSEDTTEKTRSNITRFLQDAGVLRRTGRGQFEVVPQYLTASVGSVLERHFPKVLRLLEALR